MSGIQLLHDEDKHHAAKHRGSLPLPTRSRSEEDQSPPAVSPHGGAVSQESTSRGTSSSDIENLPDLTERIRELGVYDEYSQWRDSYFKWRKGGADGAAGEVTVDALESVQLANAEPLRHRSLTNFEGLDDAELPDMRLWPLIQVPTDPRETARAGNASNKAVAFVFLKNFFGSAFMITPKGFQEAGIVGGPVCLMFVFLMELRCMLNLIKCRQAMAESARYEDLGKSISSWFPTVISNMIMLAQFGFCCIWLVSNQMNLSMVKPQWSDTFRLWIQMPPLIPLVWARNLRVLAYSNLVGIVFTCVMVLYFFYFMGDHVAEHGPQPVKLVNTANTDILLWLGTCAYAYEGINIVLPTYESAIDKPSVSKLLISITSFNTGVYIAFGMLTYYAFGNEVGSLATLNLPKGSPAGTAIPGISVTIGIMSFPLCAFVIFQMLEPKLRWSSKYLLRKWQKNAVRTFVLLLIFTVTWLGGSELQNFLALVGGFCCASLALIFPSLLHIWICRPRGLGWCLDWFICIAGTCILLLSTTQAIVNWH